MIRNEMHRSGWIWVFLLILALWVSKTVSMALAAGPAEDVRRLINEVQGILNNPALQGKAHRPQKADLVEKASERRMDYREMAKRCLPETWGSLSRDQQNEFVKTFSGLLKAGYTCRLDEFTKAKVTYRPEILKRDYAEVPIVILRPNDKIPVTFRMLNKPQGWMIYDLVIEGVSLVDNYQAQFARIIKRSSFPELLKVLQVRMKVECKP